METFISLLNPLLAVGSLLLLGFGLFFSFYPFKKEFPQNWFFAYVIKNIYLLGLVISLGAIVLSLFYSNIVGYPPCELCWYQRIAIYPQAILFFLANKTRDVRVFTYTGVFSVIGIIIALYHNWIDWGGTQFVACDTAGSCTARYIAEFGFVTIPLMSLCVLIALFGIARTGAKIHMLSTAK